MVSTNNDPEAIVGYKTTTATFIGEVFGEKYELEGTAEVCRKQHFNNDNNRLGQLLTTCSLFINNSVRSIRAEISMKSSVLVLTPLMLILKR